YQRMAQYAAELYRDDDAIAYAARAVQLSPEDAEGHRKLGEMYRKKQDTNRAISELRAAIAKNDKLFPVYFELAELLLSRGAPGAASRTTSTPRGPRSRRSARAPSSRCSTPSPTTRRRSSARRSTCSASSRTAQPGRRSSRSPRGKPTSRCACRR